MSDGFDAFVVTRGPALLRFAHVLSGDAHLAEDLVQEVLARAHRKWARIETVAAPEAYLRTAIVRQYISWRRRLSSTERAVAEVPDRGGGPDPAVAVAARDEMWALLSRLGRTQRAVLVLRFYADLPDEEIAVMLGCSHSTVRSHASRALARLRATMRDPSAVGAEHG